MTPIFLLYPVFIVLSTRKILFWVYLWQLKEYRWDRLLVHFKDLDLERGIKAVLLGGGKCHPKLTARAAAVAFFSFSLPLLPILLKLSIHTIFLALGLLWFLVPLLVLAGVLLTGVPVYFVKIVIVNLATRKMRHSPHLKVIGITGSYGKTTTKEFLAQILLRRFKVCKTEGTVNTAIGVALTVLRRLKGSDEIFVVEMGAYKKGEIREICAMVKPQVGVLTGISSQHLALFGSLKNLMEAKFELIRALPKEGEAFFNGENKHCLELAEKAKVKKFLYYLDGIRGYPLTIPNFLKLNFAGAAAVALRSGISEEEIKAAAKALSPGRTAPQIFRGANGAKIINDSFSANPDGFFAALDLLVREAEGKRKILITPGIIELGSESEKFHKQLGKRAAKICGEIIVTKKDFYRWIREGTERGGKRVICYLVEDPQKLLAMLEAKLSAESVVLVEGRVPSVIVKGLKV